MHIYMCIHNHIKYISMIIVIKNIYTYIHIFNSISSVLTLVTKNRNFHSHGIYKPHIPQSWTIYSTVVDYTHCLFNDANLLTLDIE